MEDDRVAILEAQLAQAKMIAEDSDKKYEEVGTASVPSRSRHSLSDVDVSATARLLYKW